MNFANSKAETLYWRPGATVRKVGFGTYNNMWLVTDAEGETLGSSGNAMGAWNEAAAKVGVQSLRQNARTAVACERDTTLALALDTLRSVDPERAEQLERHFRRGFRRYYHFD